MTKGEKGMGEIQKRVAKECQKGCYPDTHE